LQRIDIGLPLNFTWTAPAAGTGAIQFQYTVVQARNTWWAANVSAVVQECKDMTYCYVCISPQLRH
jgi:hypothetical protein